MHRYGDEVQLQHHRSGLFLTALAASAPLDPDCRGLALRPGASPAVFKFMPKYKAQTEGSVVYYKHFLVGVPEEKHQEVVYFPATRNKQTRMCL